VVANRLLAAVSGSVTMRLLTYNGRANSGFAQIRSWQLFVKKNIPIKSVFFSVFSAVYRA
jgi:hypothetical protein